jgi:AAA15 family ATPase/GTPase
MNNNHLTYFKVENFKKFESLEVNDIGQFNLIVGDNNVGKTCFLEALLVDKDSKQLLDNFYLALTKRGLNFQIEEITKTVKNISTKETIYPKENYFKDYVLGKFNQNLKFIFSETDDRNYVNISIGESKLVASEVDKNSNKVSKIKRNFTNGISFNDFYKQFIIIDNDEYVWSENDEKFFWIYDYNLEILNFPLVSFNDTPLEEETIKIYESLKTKQEKEILINALKVINEKIVGIDFRGNFNDLKSVFLISYADQNDFFPLNYMGDGFKRIFYIILKMLSLKGKRIMIDEIEIGIHHSKILDFWKKILNICKELDVQLFATTHSEECSEAYLEAVKELQITKSSRLITLRSDLNNTVSFTKSIKELETAIENNFNFRG